VSNHEVTAPFKQVGTLNVSKSRYSSEKTKFYLSINSYPLHVHLSFLLEGLAPFPFCGNSPAGVCSFSVSSSCSHLRLSGMRQQGVVRPDTSVQFQKHALTQYSVGRLLSGTLPLRFYPFSCGVVRQRRMAFQSWGEPR